MLDIRKNKETCCILLVGFSFLLFLPMVSAFEFDLQNMQDTVMEYVMHLIDRWNASDIYTKIFIGVPIFFFLARITGIDGGKPPKFLIQYRDGENVTSEYNPRVFFDIEIGGGKAGRIQMELFKTICPKTVENFRALCTGEKGVGKSGHKLHFKKSIFHRVIPGFMCQGGDFTRHNGTGGESIYGAKFDDEWWDNELYVTHNSPGLLSMANSGRNTNGSQFFLTTSRCKWLDCKHVVFGQVEDGWDVVKAIEQVGSSSGQTSKKVVVVDCGELKKFDKPEKVVNGDYEGLWEEDTVDKFQAERKKDQ